MRRIALASVVSVLVHATLFLPSGSWRLAPLRKAAAPVLEVHIEPQPRIETRNDEPGADPIALAAELTAAVPPPIVVPEPAREQPEATRDAPEAIDGPLASVDDSMLRAPLGEISAPTPSALEATLDSAGADLAADDPADQQVSEPAPIDGAALAADAVLTTIAPAEQIVLTRRLVTEARELLGSSAMQRQLTFEDERRRFSAELTRQPAADGTGLERVTARITTENGGERWQTSMQMKRLAFSHFTQLVDRWDDSVQLHDDEIAGRFHSNSEIFLTYDRKTAPRLLGKVTTARGIRITGETGWRSRRELFAGGLQTRSARIALPGISVPDAQGHGAGIADVHVLYGDTLLVFRADGDYDCVELASGAEARRRLTTGTPTYIIGVGDLHVRGVVNGNVTVYSPQRIVVQGDLTYVHGRPPGDDADAYLGLVSDGNIEIDRPEVTGPGDLEIHAAVYARKRFVVRNTRAREPATLAIYGSLTAGTVSATEPRYATRIEFDPRFERVRPPGFPVTDEYEIEAWDGRWRVAEAPGPN